MRVPKSPTPFSERQVEPEIQKGEFETRSPEGAFGGIDEKNMRLEAQSTDMVTKLSAQGDSYLFDKVKNAWNQATDSIVSQVEQEKGENAGKYLPTAKEGITPKAFQDAREKAWAMIPDDNHRVRRMFDEYADDKTTLKYKNIGTRVAIQMTAASGENINEKISNIHREVNHVMLPEEYSALQKELVQATTDKVNFHGWQSNLPYHVKAALNQLDNEYVDQLDGRNLFSQAQKVADDSEARGGGIKPSLEKKIHEATTWKKAQDFFDKGAVMHRNEDGQSNRKAIERDADSLKMEPADRDIYKKVIDTKMAQQHKDFINSHKNSWDAAMKEASDKTDGFKKPINPKEAHDIGQKFGAGSNDKRMLENHINNQYKKDGSGLTLNFASPEAQYKHYMEFLDDVQLGKFGSIHALESVQDELTAKQFSSLRKAWYVAEERGKNPADKIIINRLNALGVDVFGTDTNALSDYHAAWSEKYKALKPDDKMDSVLDFAKEYTKGEKASASAIWKTQEMVRPANQIGEDRITNDQMRSYYTDYGKEFTDSIGRELTKSLGHEPSSEEFIQFLNGLGGPYAKALQKYSPLNNAALSIVRWNSENDSKHQMALNRTNIMDWVSKYGEAGGVH